MTYLRLLFFSLALSAGSVTAAQDVEEVAAEYIHDEQTTIQTIDGRDLTFFIDRPNEAVAEKVPLLVMVDGSGCAGQLRSGMQLFKPGPESARPYARLAVEKPGVDPHETDNQTCSDEFKKHYTIDNRMLDHLRVFQHLSANADWWNGELLVWGWSDGGDIAAQIVTYYPNVTRALLGAMGGGYTMAEHFEDFWICQEKEGQSDEERQKCVSDLRELFQKMYDNPTWTETWSGDANSWRVWASRLKSRLSITLKDNRTPILIVHGAEDYNNTPVASARKLVSELEKSGNESFVYWEVPEMLHGWSNLPEDQQLALKEAMLQWLLDVPVGAGGPPNFGKTPAE